jgi:hypothetical protein
MEGRENRPDPISFGVVKVERADDTCLRPRGTTTEVRVPRFKYTWQPPAALHGQLPEGFELVLQCLVSSDGVRRFYPWAGFRSFFAEAYTGGLAILCQWQGLGPYERHSYRAMLLLFERAHHMAEFFRREFQYREDLLIIESGRADPTQRDILPDDLGLDAWGQGTRWAVKDLLRHGAEVAHGAGCDHPTSAERIHYGLLKAARLNPLCIANDKAAKLVRTALFDVDPTGDPDPKLLQIVTERVLTALHLHLNDSSGAFEKWFMGAKNSLVHQLSKQTQSRGGRLIEADVRQALLFLGWQAYDYASNCLHAQMRIFQNAMPHALTDQEQLLFEHMHLRQPYLGNFPLVLLAERFGFIKELLWEMWEALPDLSLVPVLHRLLDFYATMAVRRREADRRIKSGRSATFDDARYVPSVERDRFQEIAAEIRELHGINCGCPRREWLAKREGRSLTRIRILHQCLGCDFRKETILTRDEFAKAGRSIL